MKKFAMILLCVALVFSCTVIAFADPETPASPTYKITINKAIPNERYTAYKIFDVTYSSNGNAYTYSISSGSEWWTALTTDSTTGQAPANMNEFDVDGLHFKKTAQQDANNNYIYIVTYDTNTIDTEAEREELAASIANKLYGALDSNKTEANHADASSTVDSTTGYATAEIDLDATGDGYYFVTTTVGALCALNTTTPTAQVDEKNTVPTIVKNVSNDNTASGSWIPSPGRTNVSFGDEVYFKIDITDGVGTDKEMILDDQMSAGLDFKAGSNDGTDIRVFIGNTEYTEGEHTFTLTVNASNRSFRIVFEPEFVELMTQPAANSTTPSAIVTYTAIMNENAKVQGNLEDTDDSNNPIDAVNSNTATLTYAHQESESTVYVDTYKFNIVKTNTNNDIIYGATFEMYDDYDPSDATVGTVIPLVLLSTEYNTPNDSTSGVKSKTYRKAVAGDTNTVTTIDAGIAYIEGFGSGTYYFEETAAPDGYNKVDGRTPLQINGANSLATLTDNDTRYATGGGGLRVENKTGAEMPSTGGIGTYLFYGVGAILVVGAVVVLVSKKRMHAYSD